MLLEAEARDHLVYAAGTVAEAVRVAGIYMPEVILVGGELPDGTAVDLVEALSSTGSPMLASLRVVSYGSRLPAHPRLLLVDAASPGAIVRAAEEAVGSSGEGC